VCLFSLVSRALHPRSSQHGPPRVRRGAGPLTRDLDHPAPRWSCGGPGADRCRTAATARGIPTGDNVIGTTSW